MFALNTGNRITFVVDRINAKLLKKHFEGLKLIFPIGLNEFDLIKLKKPSEQDLNCINEGTSKLHKEIIEDRLFC